MKDKLGIGCIFLGVLLLCGSLSLYLHNKQEDRIAGQGVSEVLPQIVAQIPTEPDREALAERLPPLEFRDPDSFEMTELTVDGYAYVGYLSISALELNLPVMSTWDYARLRIAPCRYAGSVNSENLVLMAHNYDAHFGRIGDLKAGDSVTFTDMDGITTQYQVVSRDVLVPTAVEEITSGDFALTLFTCTYGGENRVAVYCNRQEADS